MCTLIYNVTLCNKYISSRAQIRAVAIRIIFLGITFKFQDIFIIYLFKIFNLFGIAEYISKAEKIYTMLVCLLLVKELLHVGAIE